MRYGETYIHNLKNTVTGESFESPAVYRYASWHEYHTNNTGNGLWCGDKQILGTCQFTVCGCKTEKAAKAKIRNYVNIEA